MVTAAIIPEMPEEVKGFFPLPKAFLIDIMSLVLS